ncbi:hypothetical protein V6N12_001366 [Hibiscus sabdariffa]|uniref:Uncharacterized protein n=1 Tax=Hibiscus sabdariffa TaxID=183260 RepID=A0ABR2AV27_9ROSI
MDFPSTGKRSPHYDQTDATANERVCGNVSSSVRYEMKSRHYVHVDFYGHVDYVNTIITGDVRMDSAILVVFCVEGPMTKTREHILLAKHVELLQVVELEVLRLLCSYDFLGNDVTIVFGYALLASEALMAKPGIPKGVNQWVDKIYEPMDVVDYHIHFQECKTCLPFLLAIEDVFFIDSIPNGCTIATDCIETGLQREDIQREMVLAKPGTINPYTMFTTILYVFKKKDGGEDSPFSASYKLAQFRVRTINVTGKVIAIVNAKNEEIKVIMS